MGKILNLTFHGIGEPLRPLDSGEGAYWLERKEFEALLDALQGREDVRLTFDDGNRSDLTFGLPALLARGLRAEFYVLAGRLGARGFLGEDDVRELARAGMVVGSHGMNHRSWRRLSDQDLEQEIDGAKAQMESVLGQPVTRAACPFGEYDRRALARLRAARFDRVYTSDRGLAVQNAWLQARNTVTRALLPELAGGTLMTAHPGGLLRSMKLAVKRWR